MSSQWWKRLHVRGLLEIRTPSLKTLTTQWITVSYHEYRLSGKLLLHSYRTMMQLIQHFFLDSNVKVEIVTAVDMLNYGRQIATGMVRFCLAVSHFMISNNCDWFLQEFLASNRIVHRDLAARNVLVCDDKVVKIADFGLSRDVYLQNVYTRRGNNRMPLKWMSIEALSHQVYSTYSDVWVTNCSPVSFWLYQSSYINVS